MSETHEHQETAVEQVRHVRDQLNRESAGACWNLSASTAREACRSSQQVIHEAGVLGLDQWLADYSACDLGFLRHFYATGDRRAFREFWMPGQPLTIPPFTGSENLGQTAVFCRAEGWCCEGYPIDR